MLSYQKLDQDDQILTDDPASRKLGDLDVHVAVVVLPDHEIRFFWPLLARGSHILRNPKGLQSIAGGKARPALREATPPVGHSPTAICPERAKEFLPRRSISGPRVLKTRLS